MIDPRYYSILDVDPESASEEIRRKYLALAKENHPDLFPEKERHVQHLRMMKINEAYMALVSYREQGISPENCSSDPFTDEFTAYDDSGTTSPVSLPKDPAYSCYKQGFQYYMTGQTVFHKRFSIQEPHRIRNILNHRKGILNLAVTALQNFSQSYSYFLRVVNEYPDSMWVEDAKEKLVTLEKFNKVYQKICENLGGS